MFHPSLLEQAVHLDDHKQEESFWLDQSPVYPAAQGVRVPVVQ